MTDWQRKNRLKLKFLIYANLGFNCKVCNSNGHLEIHHKFRLVTMQGRGTNERYYDYYNNLDNDLLVPLCKKHHMLAHKNLQVEKNDRIRYNQTIKI